MTHSSSESVQERRVSPETIRRVGLFSHPPEVRVVEYRRPLVSGGVDWQSIPFSDRVVERAPQRTTRIDPPAAAAPRVATTERRQSCPEPA
jgi:hypothetical protein